MKSSTAATILSLSSLGFAGAYDDGRRRPSFAKAKESKTNPAKKKKRKAQKAARRRNRG